MQVRAHASLAMNAQAKVTNLETPHFVAVMERARHENWRRFLEQMIAGTGVRAALVHVPNARWIKHYAANEDPASAMLAELVNVAD
jgi:hypothetical protein